jgi:hypothetical protein
MVMKPDSPETHQGDRLPATNISPEFFIRRL